MKFKYWPETDTLYIELKSGPGSDAREIGDGVVFDYDKLRNVIGLEVDPASSRIDVESFMDLFEVQ